ncbi:MAG: DUF2177 family protein [Rhizobium sp.]|nr:DUF2177 family protein [Rhizobium sp.]
MKTSIVAYASTFIVFLVIDFIWLSAMANVLYRPVLGDMLAPQFRLAPAVFFYLIFVAALTFFAVLPSLQPGKGLGSALLYGAFFGFAAYATYDLTNQATLKNWSTLLTVADLAWGSFVSAAAAGAGHWITTRFAQ